VLGGTKCGKFEWQPDKKAVSGEACSEQRAQPLYGVLAYTALTKLSCPMHELQWMLAQDQEIPTRSLEMQKCSD
jgi:hypothetical protein